MPKSPEQKIIELEAQVKLLEKQKALLERQTSIANWLLLSRANVLLNLMG